MRAGGWGPPRRPRLGGGRGSVLAGSRGRGGVRAPGRLHRGMHRTGACPPSPAAAFWLSQVGCKPRQQLTSRTLIKAPPAPRVPPPLAPPPSFRRHRAKRPGIVTSFYPAPLPAAPLPPPPPAPAGNLLRAGGPRGPTVLFPPSRCLCSPRLRTALFQAPLHTSPSRSLLIPLPH